MEKEGVGSIKEKRIFGKFDKSPSLDTAWLWVVLTFFIYGFPYEYSVIFLFIIFLLTIIKANKRCIDRLSYFDLYFIPTLALIVKTLLYISNPLDEDVLAISSVFLYIPLIAFIVNFFDIFSRRFEQKRYNKRNGKLQALERDNKIDEMFKEIKELKEIIKKSK